MPSSLHLVSIGITYKLEPNLGAAFDIVSGTTTTWRPDICKMNLFQLKIIFTLLPQKLCHVNFTVLMQFQT